MQVIAQFRDIDRPDVFTWMRGFDDMRRRREALAAFYGGPVWARNRDAANATMITWDNVRLLRPASGDSGFRLGSRLERGVTRSRSELVVASIYALRPEVASDFSELFRRDIAPVLVAAGATPLAMLETETTPNDFLALPVREGAGECAFVWFAHFDDTDAHVKHEAALAATRRWTEHARPLLDEHLASPPEIWRLAPTARCRELR